MSGIGGFVSRRGGVQGGLRQENVHGGDQTPPSNRFSKDHVLTVVIAALGVSGGPDSVALCVLAAGWKSDGLDRADAVCSSSGFIDGLLGIVVDHRLRPESGEEAKCVRDRVSKMGIRCEVARCDWLDGHPKQGRLQEAARDMRWVCRGVHQEWVEDPTNQNPLFARNRIRMSLRSLSSGTFKSEMQAIISACRLTRSYVDHICDKLISEAVTIMEHGYAIIDIEKLNPLKVEDLCLSRFLTLILQTALTAAGCYLCAAPGSKGTKVLVCCSIDSPLPSKTEASHPYKGNLCPPTEIGQIIENAKVYTERMVPNASEVHFLQAKSSQDVLCEAKALKLINESTSRSILSLQMEESNNFRLKEEEKPVNELKYESKSAAASLIPLKPGESCYYMNRFLVSWKLYDNVSAKATDCHQDAGKGSCDYTCAVDCRSSAAVRNMVDADWLYLANISKCQVQYATEKNKVASTGKTNHYARTAPLSDYVQVSAQQALQALKLIPVSARRGLPMLVDSQGLILNIPKAIYKEADSVGDMEKFGSFEKQEPSLDAATNNEASVSKRGHARSLPSKLDRRRSQAFADNIYNFISFTDYAEALRINSIADQSNIK
ncbi:hypothetical protein QJS04_geneDACA019344 [Acorus gramineus]|uniref:tRNA(Ile)-lysidine/2-thiocytidine synthase N-terminal domain-containing protein n=1 Tax=Acorus gramineus TaxID=55184 RepID=A0AAV9AQR6_ACOGR|nr:hypothetical protein QJS04_geneDACA019344 [Acorus gramineus]